MGCATAGWGKVFNSKRVNARTARSGFARRGGESSAGAALLDQDDHVQPLALPCRVERDAGLAAEAIRRARIDLADLSREADDAVVPQRAAAVLAALDRDAETVL